MNINRTGSSSVGVGTSKVNQSASEKDPASAAAAKKQAANLFPNIGGSRRDPFERAAVQSDLFRVQLAGGPKPLPPKDFALTPERFASNEAGHLIVTDSNVSEHCFSVMRFPADQRSIVFNFPQTTGEFKLRNDAFEFNQDQHLVIKDTRLSQFINGLLAPGTQQGIRFGISPDC